jgi:Rieske Fe-S protein
MYQFLSEFSSVVDPEKLKITRRDLIRIIGGLVVIPLAGLINQMVKRDGSHQALGLIRILANDIPQGISFHEDFVICKSDSEIHVYSAKCTHLGCRINSVSEGNLVCRCHGSEFDILDGAVIKGPAGKPLKRFGFYREGEYLVIKRQEN